MTIRQKVFFGVQVIDAPWWASSLQQHKMQIRYPRNSILCGRFMD